MLEYISGTVKKNTPTYTIIDNAGIGYFINISVNTSSKIAAQTSVTLLLHEVLREDTHDLYGFYDEAERSMFRFLISVSGVGANTARVILSKLSAQEIASAIALENVHVLQSVKGIGAKTAQRLIIDLKDKVQTIAGTMESTSVISVSSVAAEALSALVMLGFAKNAVEKVIAKILSENATASIEEIVKLSLKRL